MRIKIFVAFIVMIKGHFRVTALGSPKVCWIMTQSREGGSPR